MDMKEDTQQVCLLDSRKRFTIFFQLNMIATTVGLFPLRQFVMLNKVMFVKKHYE